MADKKKEKNFRYLFEERNNKTSILQNQTLNAIQQKKCTRHQLKVKKLLLTENAFKNHNSIIILLISVGCTVISLLSFLLLVMCLLCFIPDYPGKSFTFSMNQLLVLSIFSVFFFLFNFIDLCSNTNYFFFWF